MRKIICDRCGVGSQRIEYMIPAVASGAAVIWKSWDGCKTCYEEYRNMLNEFKNSIQIWFEKRGQSTPIVKNEFLGTSEEGCRWCTLANQQHELGCPLARARIAEELRRIALMPNSKEN